MTLFPAIGGAQLFSSQNTAVEAADFSAAKPHKHSAETWSLTYYLSPHTGEICKVGNNEERYLPGRVAMTWEWLLESQDDLDFVSGREHPNLTKKYNSLRKGPGFCAACKQWQSTPLTEAEMQDVIGGELEGWNRHKKWLKVKAAQEWQWETLKRQGKGETKRAADPTASNTRLSPLKENRGQENRGQEKGGREKGEQVEGKQEEGRQDKGKGKKIEDMTEEEMMERAMAASLVEQ